jgi:outer membrane protein OmpA-like peptidoglycan-associated protein
MRKTIVPLLLVSAAFLASPASANYFSNPQANVNLNVGSAPNPKPSDYRTQRIITQAETRTETYVPAPQAAPAPPPPPVAEYVPPAPPAPIAEPAYVRNYVVFFDFDKSTLTREAREVVAKAVETARMHGPVHITITGHTDTVGSHRYNQALSERRAMAVKNEMIRMGFNASEISTIGRSFDEPLIATGPGVREPQNRRAMIDLGNPPVASLD